MADNTIANAIKFLKGEEKSLPATKTEGQVYFAYKNVGTAEKPSYTGAIYIDTPIGGTQTRVKMTANADIADKAFNDSAGQDIRGTYLSSLGYTDDGKQTILIKGSGNNQTRVALPIASATKSGIVTTDAQSFGGTKTFVTINSSNLTITSSSGFNYSGIEVATGDKARPVWFAYDGINGKPVINTNFTYNPATQTLKVANLSGTAEKATNDDGSQNIRSTYVKYKTIKFSAVADKVYLLEGNGAGSTTATSGVNISTAIIPAATDNAAGVITTGTQTFSGTKIFNSSITSNSTVQGTKFIAYKTKMPLAGGLISELDINTSRLYGDGLAISNPSTKNDIGWIRVTGTGESDTVLELATGDDGGAGEQIVVRQYNTSNAVSRQISLLDTSGRSQMRDIYPISNEAFNLGSNTFKFANGYIAHVKATTDVEIASKVTLKYNTDNACLDFVFA